MKQFLLFFAFLFSLCSCYKQQVNMRPPNPYAGRYKPYTGMVTAEKNGLPWKGWVFAVVDSTLKDSLKGRYVLSLENYINIDGDTFRRDVITYSLLKPKSYAPFLESYWLFLQESSKDFRNWVYSVNEKTKSKEWVDLRSYDIDAVDGFFMMLPDQPNFLYINAFNPVTKEFTASFEHTFLKNNGDTIRFRNGQFSGRVYDE